MPDGVLVIDRQDHVVEANPGACGLLGVRAEALTGPLDTTLASWPALVEACREPAPARRELKLGGGNVPERRLEVRVTTIGNSAGRPRGRLVTLHDITERAQALSDLRLQTARLSALLRAGRAIAGSLDYDEVLRQIVSQTRLGLATSACLLYEYDAAEKALCLRGRSDAPRNDGTPPLAAPERRRARHLRVSAGGRPGGEPLVRTSADDLSAEDVPAELLAAPGSSVMLVPLRHRGRLLGEVVCVATPEWRPFGAAERDLARGLGEQAALAMANAGLYDQIRHLHLGNLRALSSALNAKDYYTLGHAGRVAAYMTLLGRELGWPEERLTQVQDVAYLHDIGKIGVSDRVLHKAGPLNAEEWDLIRQHPTISAEIVAPLFEQSLVTGIRHHHERFDGTGYPDGLQGQDIAPIARAMCVVDSYDAMSSQRPYRSALSYAECRAELRRCCGTQFDPTMVSAFLRALERLENGRRRALDLATAAAHLIDPVAHALLRSHDDEARPEYAAMVAALRRFRDAHPDVRFLTTFATVDDRCVTVLDTGETSDDVSHCGDPWFPCDQLAAIWEGRKLEANVLNADEFGVWITGIVPLTAADGSLAGALSVDLPAAASPGIQQLHTDLSRTLASMLHATALRMSRAELEALSDGLTGLYNHRYLHDRLHEELDRARSEETELSLLFIDLDRFKDHNDALGHKAGDEALRRVARILEQYSRRIDLAARYGGDEFALGWSTPATPALARWPNVCARPSRPTAARAAHRSRSASGSPRSPATPTPRTSCSTRRTGPCMRPSAPVVTRWRASRRRRPASGTSTAEASPPYMPSSSRWMCATWLDRIGPARAQPEQHHDADDEPCRHHVGRVRVRRGERRDEGEPWDTGDPGHAEEAGDQQQGADDGYDDVEEPVLLVPAMPRKEADAGDVGRRCIPAPR